MDNETQIKRTIEVVGFVDHNGLPTCSRRALSADCKFLSSRAIGSKLVCNFLGVDLQRSDKGVGYLRPAGGCPVWSEA